MGAAHTNRSVLNALRNPIEFQKARNGPVYEWDLWYVLIFSERWRSILLDKSELDVKNCRLGKPESVGKSAKIPPVPLRAGFQEIRENRRCRMSESVGVLHLKYRSGKWGNFYHFPRNRLRKSQRRNS